MNKEELIAEISNNLKQYDAAGIIDYISLDRWIINCLREFGGNLMTATDGVIEVKNYKATLPENFYSLVLALKCEEVGYECDEKDKKHLQSSFFYQERCEKITCFTNSLNPPITQYENNRLVVEEVYFHDKSKKVKFHYDNFKKLKLKRGYKKTKLDKNCQNLFYECPDEISIQGNYIQTNFKQGKIYLRYRGLQTDESGELVIPDMQRNKLADYIIYHCTRRILEGLLLNGDDPNVINKMNYFRNLESEYYLAAKNDAINEGLLGWAELVKKSNRKRSLKFENMFSSL